MTTHGEAIQNAFGTSDITLDFQQSYPGEPGGYEQGVDVGLGGGAAVRLPAQSQYLGTSYGGYRSYFKDQVTGAITYFQHIIANTLLTVGAVYDKGTVVGTVSPGTLMTPQAAAAGFSSGGPHLEYGVLPSTGIDTSTSAIEQGVTANELSNSWMGIDPYANLAADAKGGGGTTTQGGGLGSVPIVGGIWGGLGQIGNTITKATNKLDSANIPTDISYGAVLSALGLGTPSDWKKWGLIILLSVAVVLLVLELFRGE